MFAFLKWSVNKIFYQLSGRLLNFLGRFLVLRYLLNVLCRATRRWRDYGFKRRATAAMLNSIHKL